MGITSVSMCSPGNEGTSAITMLHWCLQLKYLSLLSSPRSMKGFSNRAGSQGRKTVWIFRRLFVCPSPWNIRYWMGMDVHLEHVDLERHMDKRHEKHFRTSQINALC